MIFCDKYFTKSMMVAEGADRNPIVKYRVFGRFDGIAALEPVVTMIRKLAPDSNVVSLPAGTPFKAKDTMMTIEGRFQDLVELETMWLQWAALPCYCANEARKIVEAAGDKSVMDFAARHMYGAESVALMSYGAEVGGIKAHSTDIGANSVNYLGYAFYEYKKLLEDKAHRDCLCFGEKGIGTTPHSLIAIYNGDYQSMALDYIKTFPNEPFIALIDYNNREIDDTLMLVRHLKDKLHGVRIDTCGENKAQVCPFDPENGEEIYAEETGVTEEAVKALRYWLDKEGGSHVKIYLSSGFNHEKTKRFVDNCGVMFDGIGTGSFIPPAPQCTADIMWVNGKPECKKGREWGYDTDNEFYRKLNEKI